MNKSTLVERLNIPWPDYETEEVTLPAWVIELCAEGAARITALEAQLFELRKWRQEYVGKLTIAEAALAEKNKEIAELRKVVKMARAVLARSLTAGYNVPGPTLADIEKAFWALDDALKSEMKAGR